VLLIQRRLYQASLEHLARLPADGQNHSQALSVQCGDAVGLGQREKAERAANRILQAPDLAEANVTSILPILTQRKGAPLAVMLLEGLVARQLASFDSLQSLGLLYKRSGQLAKARRTLEAVAQLRPGSVPNVLDLARLAEEQSVNPI
jgi:tetratricopeptide (TPR) repeat protein